MAGALGVELGGPLRYGDATEDRPRLGAGPRPGGAEIRQAIAIAARTEDLLVATLAIGAVVGLLRGWRRR